MRHDTQGTFAVRRGDAAYTHDLDGYKCFGGCFLLSERAAAERAAAIPIELSEREKAIIRGLGDGEA